MKRVKLVAIIILTPLLLAAGKTALKETEFWKKSVMGEQKDLLFYGTVMDPEGKTVSEAKVILNLFYFDPLRPFDFFVGIKRKIEKTDQQGNFDFKGYGLEVNVQDIQKEGYKATPHQCEHEWVKTHKLALLRQFVSTPENRILYKLQKKIPPQLILRYYGGICEKGWKLSEGKKSVYKEILLSEVSDFQDLVQKYPEFKNIELSLGLSCDSVGPDRIDIRFSMKGGEFIFSNNSFHKIPDEKFSSEKIMNFSYKSKKDGRLFYCIKLNNQNHYFYGNFYFEYKPTIQSPGGEKIPWTFELSGCEMFLAPNSNGIFEYDAAYTEKEMEKIRAENRKNRK